jgi:hypothetical protein
MHPAWRWFSSVCPLLALVQSEEKWEFGDEPCHNLYQKVTAVNNGASNVDDEDLADGEEGETEDKYTCPLYYKCPRHQLERDIAIALVWVLTPASFIHTRVPRQVFEQKLTFAEAVYRECDFLFIDEADRVQVQFDEAFAPDEVLVDASGNSLLNKLGLKFATAIYNSDRRSMAAELVAAGKRAHDQAQIVTDLILPQLHNQPQLVEWLGQTPFTGRSLFAHIIRDPPRFTPRCREQRTWKQTQAHAHCCQKSAAQPERGGFTSPRATPAPQKNNADAGGIFASSPQSPEERRTVRHCLHPTECRKRASGIS